MHPSMKGAVARPGIVAVLLVGVLLAGCTASAPTGTPTLTPTLTPTSTPTGDGVFRVGDLVPATGNFQFLAAAQTAGVNLAVKEINDAGGVGGVPVEVFHSDSGDAASTTAEASLADLLTKPVDVVIGPSSSVLVERLTPAVVQAGIPIITPSGTAVALTGLADDGLVFRTIPAYPTQGLALAKVISEKGPVDVAAVTFDDSASVALLEHLTAGLDAAGSTLVASQTFAGDVADFSSIVATIAAANPTAIVIATPGSASEQAKALISAFWASGIGGSTLWLTSQNTADYSQALPVGMLDGVNGIIEGWEPDADFTARLKATDGALTVFRYAAEAYDATILAALAAVVAGDDGGRSIAASLEDVSRGGIKCTSFVECLDVLQTQDDIDYDGVSGPQNWDDSGDISPAYYGVFTFTSENKFVFARGVTVG